MASACSDLDELVPCEQRIFRRPQTLIAISTRIADHTCSLCEIIECSMGVTMDPQRNRRTHEGRQIAHITRRGSIRRELFRQAWPERRMVRDHNRLAIEGLYQLVFQPRPRLLVERQRVAGSKRT